MSVGLRNYLDVGTMKALLQRMDLYHLVRENEIKPTSILMSSAILLTVHRYFGSMEFAYSAFGLSRGMTATVFMFASAFLLMGILPLLIILFLFKEHPRSYGLRIGAWRVGSFALIVLLPVIVAGLLYPASHNAEMLAFYPFAPEALDSAGNFFYLEFSRGVLFYASWEFFFRGFMLFGLRRYLGDWMAICIQMVPQCLWHIGMPAGEIFASIAGGILFGVMAIRTGSIIWPLLLHYAVGVGLDMLIFLQH